MLHGALLFTLAVCSGVLGVSVQTGLDDATITKVKANLRQIAIHRYIYHTRRPPRSAIADSLALHSWEIGTELEALTELEWPSLAVFEGDLPPPTELTDSDNAADVIAIATE